VRVANLDIDVPGDWEDHSLYTWVAPAEDISPARRVGSSPFRTNVVFQQTPLGEETLEDRVQLALKNTAESFGEVEVKVEEGPGNEQLQSRRLVYTVVDPVTNQPVSQLLYICAVGDVEWQVAFSVAAIKLRERMAEFDRIVTSIRPASQ